VPRSLAGQLFDHRVGIALCLFRRVANVDHGRRLESPGQGLEPGHDSEEADPAHQIDRVGLGVFAGSRNATRKPRTNTANARKTSAEALDELLSRVKKSVLRRPFEPGGGLNELLAEPSRPLRSGFEFGLDTDGLE
jgi:hypothetical protein